MNNKKRFIYGLLFSIALVLAIIDISSLELWNEKPNFAFTESNVTSDLNPVFTFEIEPVITIYEPKESLKTECWVRALVKLEQIYQDPNIISASMTAGWCNPSGQQYAHAWIEYLTRINNNLITVRYDPTRDVYLEPHPTDAKLLIPISPNDINKATREATDVNEADPNE